MMRIPTHRPPTHPAEMLTEEFLTPLNMTQMELAKRIGVPFQRINQIVNRKRAITPDTALRFSRLFGKTPGFWMNLQQRWNLYKAMRSLGAKQINHIKPLRRKAS